MQNATIAPRIIAAITNVIPMIGLSMHDIIVAEIKSTGARTSIRIDIWYAFCTLVTSVVMRVIKLAVE